ncbi:LLM class flavin-dependent oxidoreductase [Spirilliplanes yamanashiensis]|uniref:Luciferase n=1 Tax=Spirilliplanes yamanashiensis TaxID=42233 RepID=A0A8J3YB52_9ACTN|nr:LLM class flavin-dependent oxidoreductase [Spirilliplanes yamanashiensis]MDP9818844.1 alkanesulfonate monooxygenase SsuD/methylene tetrahydromethanopterin reductase-like flavin-dependent oxidoreductase (luciferase family) [Spirilliplanes yamanashiensis]GIJ05298.1 luciferase [Spirilliplanes yamanashiensis]
MRIGIVILPDQRWAVARRRWQLAERYGFDHAWTYDHLGWRDLADGPWFDAVPTLTAAATVTSRIRLGTFVASPNFRHPVHLTREVTALDDISGGRVLLGLGAGGGGFDATVLGSPEPTPRQRVDRFAEFLELLDELLRGDPVTRRGAYFSAVDARSRPGCVQTPRVPFVVAANGPRAMRLAARFGDGWVTTGGAGVSAGGHAADSAGAWWESVAANARRFDEALAAAGRTGAVDRYLTLDAGPVYSLSSVAAFTDAVGRAAALGFTDVVVHWPRESSWYAGDEAILESVAALLPELRGT